jgi:glycosyltransferase A (GT-A) superfamily protein (DUF2064 family)
MTMRRDAATAVILFTGDVRREERRKRLPRRLLATIHAGVAREVRRAAGCDLFVCGSAHGVTNVSGTFVAGTRPLAEQISTALGTLFGAGYESVIVIAGDVAALHARHVAGAARQLRGDSRRAVVGPCRDGGFYLAGFNQQPTLDWNALPWFGATVAAELSKALSCDAFAVEELESLDDVDDLADAQRITADRRLRIRAAILSSLGTMPSVAEHSTAPGRPPVHAPAHRRPPPALA